MSLDVVKGGYVTERAQVQHLEVLQTKLNTAFLVHKD